MLPLNYIQQDDMYYAARFKDISTYVVGNVRIKNKKFL